MNDEEYALITTKIRKLTKFDLDNYKSNQMRRRLDGFITTMGVSGVAAYCGMLERDRNMLDKLIDFLTINVSEFFRDLSYFEVLQTIVLPELLKAHPKLNIWSAGCSNGSEPYSIACILESLTPTTAHRILATDIDERILRKATAGGPYRADEIKNVPPRFRTFLTHTEEGYFIAKKIRARVEFKQHDLLQDRTEQGFNLIICRNVVIYFSIEAKNKLYRKFHSAMKDDGILFVGGTESMLDAATLGFKLKRTCFYQKLQNMHTPERILVTA